MRNNGFYLYFIICDLFGKTGCKSPQNLHRKDLNFSRPFGILHTSLGTWKSLLVMFHTHTHHSFLFFSVAKIKEIIDIGFFAFLVLASHHAPFFLYLLHTSPHFSHLEIGKIILLNLESYFALVFIMVKRHSCAKNGPLSWIIN
jgi:hypothetical protein